MFAKDGIIFKHASIIKNIYMAVGTMIAKTSSSMNANRHLSCQHWLLLIIVGVIFFMSHFYVENFK